MCWMMSSMEVRGGLRDVHGDQDEAGMTPAALRFHRPHTRHNGLDFIADAQLDDCALPSADEVVARERRPIVRTAGCARWAARKAAQRARSPIRKIAGASWAHCSRGSAAVRAQTERVLIWRKNLNADWRFYNLVGRGSAPADRKF